MLQLLVTYYRMKLTMFVLDLIIGVLGTDGYPHEEAPVNIESPPYIPVESSPYIPVICDSLGLHTFMRLINEANLVDLLNTTSTR